MAEGARRHLHPQSRARSRAHSDPNSRPVAGRGFGRGFGRGARGLLGGLLLCLLAGAALFGPADAARARSAAGAPAPLALVADTIALAGDDTIVASGNVEISVGDTRLRAERITYSGGNGGLQIEGPILLRQGDSLVILSSGAQLDRDLRNGILRSARVILERRVQLAAAEVERVDGRYTQLSNAIASACRVCAGRQPLWEIRAERIVHDQLARRIYLKRAQLRVAGVPIFFVPRLRLPDPGVRRATGFLAPRIVTNSRLGTGIKLPYFVTLGASADVTFTPYLSPETTTLQLRYRQAFRSGRLQFDGAASIDKQASGRLRGYLFGDGHFSLPRDFGLDFHFETTSDAAYLIDYGYSDKDRLRSNLSVSRTRENAFARAEVAGFSTLRGSELPIDDQLPNFQARATYERRFFPATIGGQGTWSVLAEYHRRRSGTDRIGRDVTHLGGRMNWSRSERFGPGLIGRVGGEVSADVFRIDQDSSYPATLAYVTPALEAELRWPWVRRTSDATTMVLEPVVHLAWTRNLGAKVPNEDSTLVEFDEGNLFDISRFPGQDRYETGLRASVGLKWSRQGSRGQTLTLAAGRVFRDRDPLQFSPASGLDGIRSDWLIAGQFKPRPGVSLMGRALFSDDLSLTKAEARLRWAGRRLSVASTYSWIIPDVSETRPSTTSQLILGGGYRISDTWRAGLEYHYDFDAHKATLASLGLNYANECIRVDLSLSRRFTSSTSVSPTTDVGLSVSLLGFGRGPVGKARSCSGL